MHIEEHRLQRPGTVHLESPNRGEVFGEGLPDTLILHYTACPTAQSAVDILCDGAREGRVSAHLVVGRDLSVAQLLPFNVVGWHAGVSSWDGREGLNRYSIGIEIDNAGQLEEKDGRYLSWFGQEYPAEEVVFGVHRNQSQETPWHRFPPAQLELVEALAELLVRHYGMRYVLGHEEIAPGRKIDPGPAFPLDALRARLLGGTGV